MKQQTLTTPQAALLVLLRLAIGWHFLHEAWVKLADPSWSAKGYLAGAHGPFADLFQWLAASPGLSAFADASVQWSLLFAGLSLMLGAFTTLGCIVAAGLLLLFYLAQVPWGGMYAFGTIAPGAEGTYLIVNKNLIELFAVAALAFFPTGRIVGFDAILMPLLERWTGRPTTEVAVGHGAVGRNA